MEGADAHAIAHHDAKLQECFNSGNIEFLVNLLGPIDAACGFLRKKKIKFYEEFLTGSARAPKVTRKQIHEASKTNWPDEVQQIMAVHDSVAVRMKLRPFFDNSNTSKNFIKEMIELCGGDHNRSDDCGVVVVWSECCRHQCDEGAFYIAQQYTCSHTQLEIMTSQCLTSSVCNKEQQHAFCVRLSADLPHPLRKFSLPRRRRRRS